MFNLLHNARFQASHMRSGR